MVSYAQKRNRKRYRKNRDPAKSGPPKIADVTMSDVPADFLDQLQQGLADGTIIAMGTFGDIDTHFEV